MSRPADAAARGAASATGPRGDARRPGGVARAVAATSLAVALAGCPRPRPAPPPPPPPRLVVLLVIDQLPAWAFEARAAAATGGVRRLLDAGAWWTARFPYVNTQTAPGHAALGTGAPPSVTGIVGNAWWSRSLGRERAAEEGDDGAPSSANLEAQTVAEVLREARPAARSAAVSLKARSALLPLGAAGAAAWYEADCACFTGGATAPAWLATLAAAHPIAPRLTTPWTAEDPARLAALSGSLDDAPGELAIPGWDATFPHAPADTPNPARAVINTPLGNDLVLEAAVAALAGEGLGADAEPDLLVVSLSAHDYVGHAFGLDSWEAWDAWLRLDASLTGFLDALDAAAGPGRWALALTSDHGAPPLPERRHAVGEPAATGARVTYEEIEAAAERAAATVAGPGDWIAAARVPSVHLSDAARALPRARRDALLDAVVEAVRRAPGVGRADRADALAGDCDRRAADDDRALCHGVHPERSGEVVYSPAEGAVLHKASWVDAVAHGSLHAYDRDVPVVLVAPGLAAGRRAEVASMLQVAPTLAALLGVPPPAQAAAPALPGVPAARR